MNPLSLHLGPCTQACRLRARPTRSRPTAAATNLRERVATTARTKASRRGVRRIGPQTPRGGPRGTASTEAVAEAGAEAAAGSGVGSTTATMGPTEAVAEAGAGAAAESGVRGTEAIGEAGAGARVESGEASTSASAA